MTATATPPVIGRYRIIRQLGEGGMGQVFLASHMQLEQKVAIKLLKRELTTDAVSVERFLREARAAARIDSDNVVRVIDVASTEAGQPYIVMEYLEGEDLAKRLERGPLPMVDAVDLVLQACLAIAEAHRAGIIHRDLKPANLFVVRRRDGSSVLKVVDFGISKLVSTTGRPQASITGDGLVGSPFYMSPEQVRGDEELDRRTDVWSLGLILFELLTGEGPFEAATMALLCAKIQRSPARRLADVRPDMESFGPLEDIIARCLAKAPMERYDDTIDLAMDLVRVTRDASPVARRLADNMPTKPPLPDVDLRALDVVEVEFPVEPSAKTAHGDQKITSNTWDTPARAPRRRGRGRVLVAIGGGAAVAILAIVGIVSLTGGDAKSAAAPSERVVATQPAPPAPKLTAELPPTTTAPVASADPAPVTSSSTKELVAKPPPPPQTVAKTAPPPPTATTARPPPAKTGGVDEFGGRK